MLGGREGGEGGEGLGVVPHCPRGMPSVWVAG